MEAARQPGVQGRVYVMTQGHLLWAAPPPSGSLPPCSLCLCHPPFKMSVGRIGGDTLLDFSGLLVSLGKSHLLRTVYVYVLC